MARAIALAVLLPCVQALAKAKGSTDHEPGRLLMRAERGSAVTTSRPPLAEGGAVLEGAALLDMKVAETITTTELTAEMVETTAFMFESTKPAHGSAWILVTPDTGLKTQGVPERNNFMRCSSKNENHIRPDPSANSQGQCQATALNPPRDWKTDAGETVSAEMVRYYQYCDHCAVGKRCEIVLWCLKVEMFPDVTEEGPDSPVWRVYRNGDSVRDMWTLAAGHSMCQLPQGIASTLGVSATYADESALTANHQVECQEHAVLLGFGYYQFCGTCRKDNRCMVLPVCDKCMSFDSTNWHVFKSDLAGPPCETNA